MDLDSQNRVLIDTCIFYEIFERGFDFRNIDKEIGKVEYYITRSTINELEKLAKKSIKKRKYLNIILDLIKDFKIIEDNFSSADESFISLDDYIYITSDRELIFKLKNLNKKVYRFNKRGFLECV